MNWAVLLIALLVAGLGGAGADERLKRKRPGWARWKRLLTAGAAPAAAIIVLTLAGIGWAHATAPAKGEYNREMMSFVTGIVGGIVAVVALVGGLIGAAIAERRR